MQPLKEDTGGLPLRTHAGLNHANVSEHTIFAELLGKSIEQSAGQLLALIVAVADEDPLPRQVRPVFHLAGQRSQSKCATRQPGGPAQP